MARHPSGLVKIKHAWSIPPDTMYSLYIPTLYQAFPGTMKINQWFMKLVSWYSEQWATLLLLFSVETEKCWFRHCNTFVLNLCRALMRGLKNFWQDRTKIKLPRKLRKTFIILTLCINMWLYICERVINVCIACVDEDAFSSFVALYSGACNRGIFRMLSQKSINGLGFSLM